MVWILQLQKRQRGKKKKKKKDVPRKKKKKKESGITKFVTFLPVFYGSTQGKKEKKENKNSVAVEIRWQTLLRPYPQIIYSSMKTEEKRKIQMKKLKDKDWCESKMP